jgi:hypothetical protein
VVSRRRLSRRPSIDVESVVYGLAVVLLTAFVTFAAINYSTP